VLDTVLYPERERARIAEAQSRIARIHERLLAALPALLQAKATAG
jgi:hypothetical protein